MLTDYIAQAMRLAHYETLENGRYWGEMPPLQGVWAEGQSLEECGRLCARSWSVERG